MGSTSPIEDRIIALRLEGLSQKKIADQLGRSQRGIGLILKRRGVVAPPVSNRRYPLLKDFFDVIDTEEKAYWLGFITADGHIARQRGRPSALILNLSAVDTGHLEKLRSAISPTSRIKTFPSNKGSMTASLGIHSVDLVNSLAVYGVVPRKSLISVAWDGPPNLMRHYWRGVFDGDGSIKHYGRGLWAMNLTGTDSLVTSFRLWLAPHVNTRAKIRPHQVTAGMSTLALTGRRVCQQLALVLYGNATIVLDRKMVTALELLATTDKPRTLCTIKECGRVHYGKGFCAKHYQRWRKWGDPLVTHLVRGSDGRFIHQ